MKNRNMSGHLMALICVSVWGSTVVVSKGLLLSLSPVQLMFLRFVFAYGAMWFICPKWFFRWREEWRFLGPGADHDPDHQREYPGFHGAYFYGGDSGLPA